ncbi:hypothetical protein D9Q98_000312 [Chlorella vulgaris]|uniref:Ketoreductase domain-containing protein n=1 Tax=Chlorella vulgaris TaxID=3077 RepID=A0A9D4TZ45_CHLVU|nr:hypothetical protein D9Q98_000312 [Chlorella vulgaris]
MVVGSAWLLSVSVQLTGAASAAPLWLPVLAGGVLGAMSLAAHEHGVRRLWRSPDTPLRVLITGGSSGVGKALAREFLKCGDSVLVTSRSAAGSQAAAEQLREEAGGGGRVMGMECDVSNPDSVEGLMDAASELVGGPIDVVINNAGYSGSFQSLSTQTPEQVQQVVQTNLLGSLLVTRAAMNRMAGQPGGGHIFNTEGAGSDGSATPQYAAYGATKCAIAQLLKTMQHEAAGLPNPVRIHNLSPGMVLTPLLLDGATTQTKQVFNILCEHPETVAAFLVPRVRSTVALGHAGRAIRFLTPTRALLKFLTAPLHAGKYFDKEGRAVYAPERERLLSATQAKKTRRRQQHAARRSIHLQVAYSFCMALSFLLIVSDAVAKAPAPGL